MIGVLIINILKKVAITTKKSIKLILLIILSFIILLGLVVLFYNPTYEVHLNGEFIGYTNDKNGLQKKINEYMKGIETQNIAFVDIQTLPEYSLCFVKRDSVDNSDEILEKVKSLGTTYYEYYAILLEDEEKYYVPTKEEAEAIIDELKEKDSNNIKDISYTQVYNTELKEYTAQDQVVAGLYEKKKVYYSSGSYSIASAKIELGIDLIKPVTSGYTITSRFGSRSSGMHTGLDIAAPAGTPIYAAASGTVVASGWSNTGYGYYIIISHENGVQTLYGHCSALYVSAGQYVAQGENIAAVGSTGNSTGNHLHLEIRVNGSRVNPQYYLY